MIRVLFVCLGNICRSPMAESVFLHQVRAAGLAGQIEVDSAGTGDWHIGARPHDGTLQVLKLNGIAEGSSARQLRQGDVRDFNYIVAMDNSNLSKIKNMTHRASGEASTGETGAIAEVHRLLDFVADENKEVPDPYFTGDFGSVFEMVTRGCASLLSHIRTEHQI